MGRIMAIDYGTKRIGLAVTDPLGIFASPLCTVSSSEFDSFIDEYSKKEEIEAFVIGYPVQLNNMASDVIRHIDPFIKKLKKKFPNKPVHMADERFTSRMAYQTMIEGGVKKMDRRDKSMIDKISASIILQSYLDYNKRK
jgi:putative Holliday junction resolvase